ncbi:glycosyltransferase WbsX family protein [Rossellomorea marisflavi]|uniref:glycosyltransferase WbsX family protein n=1 Tax=Rossellomorea marisflavi TaxID=189381 RepID=UPI00345D5D58
MTNRCKVLALYLPQFHRIPENDEWWGEGFTEWNVVKNSKQFYKEIPHPRIPSWGYYDLSIKDNLVRQAKTAKEYNVDGYVMYNYYSNGKCLLSKPSEILLDNKDIDISYCFSWANHDWLRTWFSYNRELLQKQEYAKTTEEIKNHFMYLLRFFTDERYIKIKNKPVLFIYKYQDINNFDQYQKVWNDLAREHGFDGIYFVQTLGGTSIEKNTTYFDACYDFEPTYTTFKQLPLQSKKNKLRRGIKKITNGKFLSNVYDYKKVTNSMVNRKELESNHFLGVFAEWDNTPRHNHNGTVFKNFSLDTFRTQFENQYKKSIENDKSLLIIDAWNEWGEGAYLEPDEYWQYGKLEVIKEVVESFKN